MSTIEVPQLPVFLHQALASFSVTEWARQAGYDGVIIDLQHGEVGLEQGCAMLRAIPRGGMEAYVRVGSLETGPITRLLDSGATGIIAPTVETSDQAAALVRSVKYPPLGSRSLGPTRPALYSGGSYTEAGNASVKAIVQIETVKGMENADAILDVDGVDAVYIGPADLAVSHGLTGRPDWEEGPVWEDTLLLAEKCRTLGIDLGTYCSSPDYARRLFDKGLISFSGLGIDLLLVARGVEDCIKKVRGQA